MSSGGRRPKSPLPLAPPSPLTLTLTFLVAVDAVVLLAPDPAAVRDPPLPLSRASDSVEPRPPALSSEDTEEDTVLEAAWAILDTSG